MKVFISWSGATSKALAAEIRDWLPAVIQAVQPYFSPDDIAKGSRWGSEIAKELDAASVGIICLTPDNLQAPWILFEAGALAKKLDKARVCPIVFGLSPTDVKDPLAQFQAARFDKAEIKKLVKMMNAGLGESALDETVLATVFDMWWPKLEESVNEILANPEEEAEDLRTERDILEEILALSRRSTRQPRTSRGIHPEAVAELATSYLQLCDSCHENPLMHKLLSDMFPCVSHIAMRGGSDRDYLPMVEQAKSLLAKSVSDMEETATSLEDEEQEEVD